MSDSDVIAVGNPLPQIAWAVPLDGRKVKVVWADGRTKVVDLTAPFANRRIFIPLRSDDALFRTLHVSEYGSALEWDGPDLELSASWLDHLPEAEFTNEEFLLEWARGITSPNDFRRWDWTLGTSLVLFVVTVATILSHGKALIWIAVRS